MYRLYDKNMFMNTFKGLMNGLKETLLFNFSSDYERSTSDPNLKSSPIFGYLYLDLYGPQEANFTIHDKTLFSNVEKFNE